MRRLVAPCLFFALAILVPGVVAAQQQCSANVLDSDALVAYWPLDVDGDEVVHGFPGTLEDGPTFGAGQVGGAVTLDGNGAHINAGAHDEIANFPVDQMSISVWLYPTGDDNDSFVVGTGTACSDAVFQLYDRLGGGFSFARAFPEETQYRFYDPSFGPVEDEWSHIVVTIDGNTAHWYVNGVEEAVVPASFGNNVLPRPDVQNVNIGFDSCSSFYTGSIDELLLFDEAISAADVSILFGAGDARVSACADSDADGVADYQDVCSGTAGTALVDGCDCGQILDFKPGKGGKCNGGTLNVFRKRVGWAKNVPLPGGSQ